MRNIQEYICQGCERTFLHPWRFKASGQALVCCPHCQCWQNIEHRPPKSFRFLGDDWVVIRTFDEDPLGM